MANEIKQEKIKAGNQQKSELTDEQVEEASGAGPTFYGRYYHADVSSQSGDESDETKYTIDVGGRTITGLEQSLSLGGCTASNAPREQSDRGQADCPWARMSLSIWASNWRVLQSLRRRGHRIPRSS